MNYVMDELEARAHRQLHRLRELGEQLAAIRISETSPDREVTAVVDGNGTLLDLQFTSSIAKLAPADFEKLLVATAGMAAQRAFAQRGDLVTVFNEEFAELTSNVHVGR